MDLKLMAALHELIDTWSNYRSNTGERDYDNDLEKAYEDCADELLIVVNQFSHGEL